VDIESQSVGDLAVDIASSSINNLGIDIQAQSINDLGVDIQTQTLSEVSTSLETARAESVRFDRLNQTGNVAGNFTNETVIVQAPAGKILELASLNARVSADTDQTSGTHSFTISSETQGVVGLFAQSNAGDSITITGNAAVEATSRAEPSNEAAQATTLSGLRVDENNGLKLNYRNATNAPMENGRGYQLWFREIEVA
jgi:hypothetical protein